MPIMTKPPEWYNQGSEPPENKKVTGWEIDERPPAGWFNWLFHRGYQSLLEIASALGDHRDAASGVHGVSAEDTVESAQGAQAKADAAAAVVQDNLDIHASDATNPHHVQPSQLAYDDGAAQYRLAIVNGQLIREVL